MNRDELNKALEAGNAFLRHGNHFAVLSVYPVETNNEPRFLIDYIKLSTKASRVRTRDLISFCRKFTPSK